MEVSGREWVPVAIQQSSGHSPVVVRWMRAGREAFAEPFFDSTTRRLRMKTPAVLECETPLDGIHEFASRLSPIEPRGIIFHMSRCGSTLLLNAMRTAGGVLGLGEAEPIEAALRFMSAGSMYWKDRGMSLIRDLVTIFGNHSEDTRRAVIIKSVPVGIVSLPLLRSIWPAVPCIILIRDPVEVLVSNLRRPPAWLVERYNALTRTGFGTPPR